MKWKDAEIISKLFGKFPLLALQISISHSRGITRVLKVLSKGRQIRTGKMTFKGKKQDLIDAVVYL
jgi:lysophospholipid acyltransferase (LPLAT)-like uncharacterized protein